MDVFLEYDLDLKPESCWNMISATAASKASLLYLQESGDFWAGPRYYTTREGFNSYLIKLVLSGCGTLEYKGQVYMVPPGHFLWIDCRKWQRYRTRQDEGNWHVLWVHFFGGNAQFYYDTFLTQNDGSPVAAAPIDSPIFQLMPALLALDNSGSNQQKTDLEAANLLTQLVTACAMAPMTTGHAEDIPQTIQAVRLYLLQHYQEKTTLEALGARFNLNPFYLQKQFKRYVGQSPTEYQIYLRMTKAKELMRTTHKSIGEIAYEVGIDNPGYFTRRFKQQEGMTPQEYRRLWPIMQEA